MKASLNKVFFLDLLTSLLIELTQLLVALCASYTFRMVDIDDIIMNVLGTLIGYLVLFKQIYKISKKKLSISINDSSIIQHLDNVVSASNKNKSEQ